MPKDANSGKYSMVQVMVNPGRRVRDKINNRDAVGGDIIEVRDVERKVLIHRGYVSDPPPNDSQAGLSLADETQMPAVPVGTPPVAAPEPSVESEPARQHDLRPEDRAAEFKASLAQAPDWKDDGGPPPTEEAEPAAAEPESEGEAQQPSRRRYRRRDMTAEES
jgi:hypothetical protein